MQASDRSIFHLKQALLSLRRGLVVSGALLCLPFIECVPSRNLEATPLIKGLLSRKSFVSEAVARTGPAVVTLETQRTISTRGTSGLPPGLVFDPYFRRFFGLQITPTPRRRVESSQGSGVIFAKEGLVLTNAHVVEKTDQLIVGLSDGRRVSGRVVGLDSLTDLAVVRLDGSGPWPIASLGDSDKLLVGDWAIAVGNPFGLENTVTLGIISNLNRNVSQLGISGKRLDLIQTDAAINPGNSGGPLLNAEGEVIGINTLVRSGPGAGLGFAIPINRARTIAKQLVEKGRASHPMVGIGLAPVSSKQPGAGFLPGAEITYVVPRGPAEKGGLKVGDIIVSIGRERIEGPADVVSAINNFGVGTLLSFGIRRGSRRFELLVTPVEMSSMRGF
ncbi:trypsin-like peptidase domain-containing protein [Prochlorococcus sp. MIT 1341]|uniref:trypsin-like peptidase domain-containing protein n=1 Tax=Prochlorococcus sp. MIT 1341 TaxID=3096221 RepID=UPI002A749D70|nr:trypsin-like peptidase domain-containing protein [Prochlorococcus sp. MIT 1341]